jgi:hypothetical protein
MSSVRRAASPVGLGPALALALGIGCTTTLDGSLDSAPDPDGRGGGGEPLGSTATSITFLDPELVLVPADLRPVGVVVEPPRVHRVRFTLLGDSKDAFLDHAQLDTAADGTATVRLRAPSTPSTFRVRASVGDRFAEIVAEQSRAETPVDVKPRYAGQRNVESWIATIRTGTDCTAAPGEPPPDGPLRGESPASGPVRVSGVPLGTPLTVILRSERFAWGCEQLASGFEGVSDRTPEVSVTVTDRPLRLEGARLPIRLGVDLTADLLTTWEALASRMARHALGPVDADSAALLDRMAQETPLASRPDFQTARTTRSWDAIAAIAIALDGRDDRVRTTLTRRLVAGLTPLGDRGLSGTLSTLAEVGTEGEIELASIGGIDAKDAGMQPSVPLTLTAEPLDRLLFGGRTAFEPSRLLAALGEAEALGATRYETMSAALAADVGCAALAAALADMETGLAYRGCDTPCLAARCEQALGALWEQAAAAEATDVTIEVAASGDVTRIDGEARPLAFEGTWVGTTALVDPPPRLGGPALAGAPLPASP